jgi:phosphoglycerate dehydrogenase-like enzyme
MKAPLIKVTSPSFSKNPFLKKELGERNFQVVLNSEGTRLEGAGLAAFLAEADGAIIGLEKVDDALLARCPKIRAIAKYGVGLDNIDAEACKRRNIFIGWTAGVNRRSVAELTLGQMIGLAHNVFPTMQQLKQGKWNKEGGVQLSEKIVGIIGVGNIGKELIELLRPFHCKVLINDVLDLNEFAQRAGVTLASKEQIFREADFVTLHIPLTNETRYLINEDTLKLFRPEAFLINTSRGPVVKLSALKAALSAGQIQGAALDVYEEEPPTDLELLKLPNLVCTPHISGNAFEAVLAMGRSAIAHLDTFFETGMALAPADKR